MVWNRFSICSSLGKIEKNGKCKEANNWIIHNKTYIFGGGNIWQPLCNKTRREILNDVVTKPDEFLLGGKCFGRHIGKVYFDECSPYLKKGVAFVENKDTLRIGIGHGGLLGGLDKETIYYPVPEQICKQAEKLDRKRQELDSWELGKRIPKNINIPADTRKKIEECGKWKKQITEKDSKIQKELENCIDTDNLSPTSISASVKKCNLSVFDTSDNIDVLIQKGITDRQTVEDELKYWGEKINDIKKVYHNTETPFILEMKDGKMIIVAPKITKKSEKCYKYETYMRNKLNKEAETINGKIRDLLNKVI